MQTVAQTVPVDTLEEKGFFPADNRAIGDPLKPSEGMGPFGSSSIDADPEEHDPVPGYITQVSMLFSREVKNKKRDKTVFVARVVLMAIIAIFVGMVFLHVGETSSRNFFNLHSHFGAVTACCVVMMVVTSQSVLMTFPAERPIFLREYTTDHYTVASYFTSRLAMEVLVTGVLCLCMVSSSLLFVAYVGSLFLTFTTNSLNLRLVFPIS